MKKFKTKRPNNYQKLIILVIFFVLFLLLFIFISSLKLNKSYKSLINYLLKENIPLEKRSTPINYLMGNLDYLISSYVFEDKEKIIIKNDLEPLIYIYNTHDTEKYKNDNISVKTVSLMLQNNLKEYNISSIVEDKSVSSELKNNYNDSYKISRKYLEEIVLKNNNLNYFIDIHRDSVDKSYTEITINNKEYARILFVLGLENKDYLKNKDLMIRLNNYLNEHYEGISRGIYEKQGSGVNGVYNQDFHQNTILIEVGGIDSNLEGIFNSTQIIARALYYIIGEDNEKIS